MRNLARFALLAGLAMTSGACNTLDDAMVRVFGRSMRDQASFDPYENTRLPAEGSVAFSAGNLTLGPGDVNIGNPEQPEYIIPDFSVRNTANPADPILNGLENPVATDDASLERGQELYMRYCVVCHGPEGVGADAYVVEKWPALVAYNLAGETVQGYSDGYIYGMIRVGRGSMPQYGHQISHFDRWNIVNYVRQLQAEYNAGQGNAQADANAEN